ncbi:glycoside hydrolase family protein [Vibrio penaeicida]|uniref:glycoside hydrolase family protein n=1 Tax=Vibrio penaeicida TaxID=104609 RepID=UPI000CEA379C|nr:glycoside hydrolase family protein [Vibrio penaeicida]
MNLTEQLKRHEGFRRYPYHCSAGKLTIGFGRNLEDVGIDKEEAEQLLENDVQKVKAALAKKLPWYQTISPVRQAVLENMAFNMGVAGLLTFKKMLRTVKSGDYASASNEMLDSLWAKQVGKRATELAEQMKTGRWA